MSRAPWPAPIGALALSFMFASASLAQQTPSAAVPREVQAAHAEAVAVCRAEGGRLAVRSGYLSRADFNADGRPDYILRQKELTCSSGFASSPYCGSRGCNHILFISRGSGFYPQIDIIAYDATVERLGTRTLLLVNKGEPGGGTRWGWSNNRFDVMPFRQASTSLPPSTPRARTQARQDGAFPFREGVYTNSASCNANSGGLVEFARESLHHWEADQSTSFVRVVERAPGRYSIDERFNSDEDGDPIETVEYERINADSFRRTSFQRWDERKQSMVPAKVVETYKFCRPLDRR